MIVVLSRAQMRAYDRFAIETCHVPGVVLMENAGRGASDVISAMVESERRARGVTTRSVADFPVRPAPQRNWSVPDDPSREADPLRGAPPHTPRTGQPASYPLDARIVVVCGTGNNGGDGFVVARHLLARGADVEVFLTGASEKVTGESRINHDAYIDLGGRFVELSDPGPGATNVLRSSSQASAPHAHPSEGGDAPAYPGALRTPLDELREALLRADYVVDAIFGTGLDRPVRGHLANVISVMNDVRRQRALAAPRIVSLDVPSGLDSDSGAPLGTAIEADDTVTFGHMKIGLLTPAGARLSGHIHVVDLGVPDKPILTQIGHIAEVIREETIASYFQPRAASVHKHQAGHVLVVAGSPGKLGAAFLSGTGAMRAGAGLVTLCTWPDAASALEARVVELMTARVDPSRIAGSLDEALSGKRAVAIGPGLGLDEKARIAVDHIVLGWDGVKIVDADALTHFVGRPEVLAKARGHLVLTPHPGELGRLLGRDGRAIEQDRFGAVLEAVSRTRATVILKGARTIVALPDKRLFICMAGNPVLATAGSGDVLTGILAAFACHLSPERAACAGVLVHALAGDLWRSRTGSDRGMLASEIAALVPEVLASL